VAVPRLLRVGTKGGPDMGGEDSKPVGRYPPVSMTPDQFEQVVLGLLNDLAEDGVEHLRVEHQDPVAGPDGEFVMDGTVRYRLMGADFLVLMEAKLQKRPVGRQDVQVLRDKVRSVGAHKGILASSAGFQRGALRYARAHGIGLAQIADNALTYEVRAEGVPLVFPPGSRGFAVFEVYGTEGGHGTRRLDGTGYIRDLLPGLEPPAEAAEGSG